MQSQVFDVPAAVSDWAPSSRESEDWLRQDEPTLNVSTHYKPSPTQGYTELPPYERSWAVAQPPYSLPKGPSWNVLQSQLKIEFERSTRLLDLGVNWDDEGSPGYTEEVIARARRFVEQTLEQLYDQPILTEVVPSIDAGPNGSIDLYWQHLDRELVVNIPAHDSSLADFYGTNHAGQKVKGSLDPDAPQGWLLAWLAE